jgi:hypothetical protein
MIGIKNITLSIYTSQFGLDVVTRVVFFTSKVGLLLLLYR